MTKPIVSQEALQDAIRDLLIREPQLFAAAFKEALEHRAEAGTVDNQYITEKEIKDIVAEDFKRYDAVFRALA